MQAAGLRPANHPAPSLTDATGELAVGWLFFRTFAHFDLVRQVHVRAVVDVCLPWPAVPLVPATAAPGDSSAAVFDRFPRVSPNQTRKTPNGSHAWIMAQSTNPVSRSGVKDTCSRVVALIG